jgi:hypothetical protein
MMSRIFDSELDRLYSEYVTDGRSLPLEVVRSRYDDVTTSWEVMYTDSPWDGNGGSSSPIAEFTSWHEAQHWAVLEARKSKSQADSRETLGPKTEQQQWRDDVWDSYHAGVGVHPYEIEHLSPERRGWDHRVIRSETGESV